ncbi:LysR family transcriptional regulator [Bradyrhizobium canariense]|uniref:LysR family transcriptional regulator n=1 Tax=Bradyrhizobium canariense TaxID=255045 RepID=UPI0011BA6C48
MDLRRLRHFVVAAEESNFRRAALRLDTNQSIISRHVRDIEEELGADLFLREPGHGARPREVGRAFLRDVREMFDNLASSPKFESATNSPKIIQRWRRFCVRTRWCGHLPQP